MRPDGYLKTAWIMTILFSIILPLHSQTPRQFSIELKDKPLPAALKLIEKEGGKNLIIFDADTPATKHLNIMMIFRNIPYGSISCIKD